MRNIDRISGIILLIFGFGVLFMSFTYPIGSFRSPGAGLFPLLASIVLIGLSVILTVQTFKKKEGKPFPISFFPAKEAPKRILFGFLALLGFRYMLPMIGFAFTTFLFLLFLAKYLGHYSWRISLVLSVLTAVISYYLFQVWLKIPMPQSVFGF